MSSIASRNEDRPETGTEAPALASTYAQLPERFFAAVAPALAEGAEVVAVNEGLAAALGIDPDWLGGGEGFRMMAGQSMGVDAEPIAMAYAGHQFGNFVPQLGDGRAILLGEVLAPDGVRYDLHLKGAGRTPFSRGGDGNAVLGPVLREYVISEAMAALGVPTTRALAAIKTGTKIFRDGMEPGARLLRVAQSHVRVGTFQYFAARQDHEALGLLTNYVLQRHYPDVASAEVPALALLEQVGRRQAELVAHWHSIGFIHGVMNTDNSSIAGETIDYGPCAFMDFFNPPQVYSSIDKQGRYAFGNQPSIAHWNLVKLAEALLPVIDADPDKAVRLAQTMVNDYSDWFGVAYLRRYRAKLGLAKARDGDADLIAGYLSLMAKARADFTLSWRVLADAIEAGSAPLDALFGGDTDLADWLDSWRARLADEGAAPGEVRARMLAVNPLYIPRNHLVQEMIEAAYGGDLEPFETLMQVLSRPFEEQDGREAFTLPPEPDQMVERTFCGT